MFPQLTLNLEGKYHFESILQIMYTTKLQKKNQHKPDTKIVTKIPCPSSHFQGQISFPVLLSIMHSCWLHYNFPQVIPKVRSLPVCMWINGMVHFAIVLFICFRLCEKSSLAYSKSTRGKWVIGKGSLDPSHSVISTVRAHELLEYDH